MGQRVTFLRAEQQRRSQLVRPKRCNTDDDTQQLSVEVQVTDDEQKDEQEQEEEGEDALNQGMAAEEMGEQAEQEEHTIQDEEEEGRVAVGMTTPPIVSRK